MGSEFIEVVERTDDLEFSCSDCMEGEEVIVPVQINGNQECNRCGRRGYSELQQVFMVQRK